MNIEPKYLTLTFDDMSVITLQYHPETLSLSESSNSVTIPGLSGIHTQTADPRSVITNINVSTTLTIQDAPGALSKVGKLKFIKAFGSTLGSQLVSYISDGKELMASNRQIANYAKGEVDLKTGLIRTFKQKAARLTFDEKKIGILTGLRDALRNTSPCSVNFDLQLDTTEGVHKFFIKSLSVDVRSIQEDTGRTLAAIINIQLIEHGGE
jgi:hypothetical protein